MPPEQEAMPHLATSPETSSEEDLANDPLYQKLSEEIKRRKKLSFLGPVLSFVFALYLIGINFQIPVMLLLNRRVYSIIYAVAVCVIYYLVNLYALNEDLAQLKVYARKKQVPSALSQGHSYRRTQIISLVALVILVVGIVLIQKPSHLAPASLEKSSLPYAGFADALPEAEVVEVSKNSSFFAPEQFQLSFAGSPESGQKSGVVDSADQELEDPVQVILQLDIYGMRSSAWAEKLYQQMAKVAAKEPRQPKDAQSLEDLQSYEGDGLEPGIQLQYQSYKLADQGKVYNFLAWRGQRCLVGSYLHPELEELLPLLNLLLAVPGA